MPTLEYGSSWTGLFKYSAMGTGGTIAPNSYFDVLIEVPMMPTIEHPEAVFVLVHSRTVIAALPAAWVAYSYVVDRHTIGVRWMHGGGTAATLPSGEYDILIIL